MPLAEDEKITIEVSGLILLIKIYPVMLLKRPKCRFFFSVHYGAFIQKFLPISNHF